MAHQRMAGSEHTPPPLQTALSCDPMPGSKLNHLSVFRWPCLCAMTCECMNVRTSRTRLIRVGFNKRSGGCYYEAAWEFLLLFRLTVQRYITIKPPLPHTPHTFSVSESESESPLFVIAQCTTKLCGLRAFYSK